jgi:hypothetical protein
MLVYIAAPLGDPDPTIRAWHRERANLLSALAFTMGHIPVCVHTYAELAIGSDTDPDARARGVGWSMQALVQVQDTGGLLWELLKDDGAHSVGALAEHRRWVERWRAKGVGQYPPRCERWSIWRITAERFATHLLPEFDRLAVRP